MPDITANKPTAGAPVESAWGGQVHDMLEGFQCGTVTLNISNDSKGEQVITLPRPYVGPATAVFVTAGPGNGYAWIGAYTDNVTGVTLKILGFHRAAAPSTVTLTLSWMAWGKFA